MEFKPVTLKDRPLINEYFRTYPNEISDFTFTNIFMWQNSYDIQYAWVNDFLCFLSQYGNHTPYFVLPEGDMTKSILPLIEDLFDYTQSHQIPFYIKSTSKNWVTRFEEAMPQTFSATMNRNDSDYIYLSKDLIELKGKKYHQKRNHINQFNARYDYIWEFMAANHIDELVETINEWCAQKDCTDSLEEEKDAILILLRHFQDLNYKGLLIRIDGRIKAFSLGEPLNSRMAVIHIEKADPNIRGLYPAITQKFCELVWKDYLYINREEDMGLPGLRKAKLSFRPVKFVKKYDITVKKTAAPFLGR